MRLIFVLFISSFSCKQPTWYSDFEDAKKKAGADHKLLLINFSGSDWCEACSAWSQKVLVNNTFRSLAAKHLLLVNADYPRNKKVSVPSRLQKQYDVLLKRYNPNLQFPFTVLVDEYGSKIAEWELSQMFTPEKFLNDINRTVSIHSLTWQQVKQ